MTAGDGLVSVIIPVFNRKEMLEEAVSCVVNQTYRPVEVVVVDDGSTDGTESVADRLAAESPGFVRTLHRPNGGPGAARETGRLAAHGEFLQYLDSDDWLDPRKVELQVAALRADPGAGIAYCPTREYYVGSERLDIASQRTGEPLPSLFPALLGGRVWQTVTPLWRRSLTDAIGPWSTLRHEEDWEYDARAGSLGAQLVFCPEFLADFRHHGQARASAGDASEPGKMRERANAHELIYQHARRAGIAADEPLMARFARECFLLARQCGAARLPVDSERLFCLAREASGKRRDGLDFWAYLAATSLLGWSLVGSITCWLDRFRSSPAKAAA